MGQLEISGGGEVKTDCSRNLAKTIICSIVLGAFGSPGPSWAALGGPGRPLERFWALLAGSWAVLIGLGWLLAGPWAVLRGS